MQEVVSLDGTVEDIVHTRRTATRLFDEAHCSDRLASDALVCLSELVTNAVLHAGGPVEVALVATPATVRVEVSDPVPPDRPGLDVLAQLRRRLFDAELELDRETGRGLVIVNSLARTWGVHATTIAGMPGKTVFALLVDEREAEGLAPRRSTAPIEAERRVLMRRVPIRLFLASEAHVESLVRELHYQAAQGTGGKFLNGLGRALGRRRAERTAALEHVMRLLDEGREVVDLVIPLRADSAFDAVEHLGVVELAESLTGRGDVDERSLDELRRFRRWYAMEVQRQAEGFDPSPCPFQP